MLLGAAAGLGFGLLETVVLAAKKVLFDRYLHLNPQIAWLGPLAYGLGFAILAALLTLASWRAAGPLKLRIIAFAVVALGASGVLFAAGGLHRGALMLLGAGFGVQAARMAGRAWPGMRAWLGRFVLSCAAAILLIALAMNLWFQRGGRGAGMPAGGAMNVLWVIWDTVRADNLSVYGYDRRTSPILEQLAARGTTFNHAVSPSPWTLPSHASMFTGRSPHELDAGWRSPLERGPRTVAEIARASGYRTGGFIANLFYASRESGLARGFSTWIDYPIASVPEFLRSTALARAGFNSTLNPLRLVRRLRGGAEPPAGEQRDTSEIPNAATLDRNGALAAPGSDRGVRNDRTAADPERGPQTDRNAGGAPSLPGGISGWLRRLQNEGRKWAPEINHEFLDWVRRDDARPFFAVLNYFDAHDPYRPPPPFDTAFGGDGTTPSMAEGRRYSAHDVERLTLAYDASIAFLDHHFGALLDQLETMGILDNTIVIVTSDHGEEFGEHGVFTHGHSLYQPSLRVPLVIVAPGRGVPAGRRIDAWVTTTDLASTVLGLAGLDASNVPGRSLARFWTMNDSSAPRTASDTLHATLLYSWAVPEWYPIRKGDMESVFADPWKYIRNGDGSEELYDLRADPGESRDLHAAEGAAGLLPAFRASLETPGPDPTARSHGR